MESKQSTIVSERGQKARPQSDATAPMDPKLEYDAAVLREGWLRAAAELDNLRKRTAAEVGAAREEERAALLRAFLEVVDNLERALASHEAGRAHDPSARGVQAVHTQMLALLKRFGAEPIEALGRPFDPSCHEAVGTEDVSDQPQGAVAEVLQTGYRLTDGGILRPARVVVVQHPHDDV